MTQDEEGFTLIELLIAVILAAVMLAAVGSAMIVAFRTISARAQGVTDSGGAQLLVSYLVSDVQAAEKVQPTDFRCDSAALLELRSVDADTSLGRMTVTTYSAVTGSTGSQLSRAVYTMSSTATACAGVTPDSTVLVRDVDPAGTAARCDNTATCSNSSLIVGLRVKAYSIQTTGTVYGSYTFDVSGTRRVP